VRETVPPDNAPRRLPATVTAAAGQQDGELDAWLTGSAAKAVRYCDDIYFRESWKQACELLPDPALTLRANTYVLIKPETVATGRVEQLLELIRDRGYLLLDVLPVVLDRYRTRALWQYQLNAAPLATLATVDLIVSCGPSAIALLAEEPAARQPGVSASQRLSAMKGVSFGSRRPDDIRTLLGAVTRMFSYLHVPDEPADLVRELGIWFDHTARHRVYRRLAGAGGDVAPRPAIAEVARRLEGDTGVIDLDLDRALDTVARTVAAQDRPRLRQVRNWLSGEPEDATLLDVVRWLSGLTDVPAWTRALIAAHLVQGESPERAPLL
jgi:nucleoside diphosphate kinase